MSFPVTHGTYRYSSKPKRIDPILLGIAVDYNSICDKPLLRNRSPWRVGRFLAVSHRGSVASGHRGSVASG